MLHIKFFDNQDLSTTVKTSIFSYTPGDKSVYQRKGSLTAFIKISSDSAIDSINLSKFIWNALLDEYRASEEDVVKALNLALLKAKSQIRMLIEHDPSYIDKGIDAEIALNVILDTKLYFSIFGEPAVYILRDGKATDVTAVLSRGNAQVINTLVKENDIYVFSEKSLSKIGINEEIVGDTNKLLKLLSYPEDFRTGSVGLISRDVDFDKMLIESPSLVAAAPVENDVVDLPVEREIAANVVDIDSDITNNGLETVVGNPIAEPNQPDLKKEVDQAGVPLKPQSTIVDLKTERESRISGAKNISPEGSKSKTKISNAQLAVADVLKNKIDSSTQLSKVRDMSKRGYNKAYQIFDKSLISIKNKKDIYLPKAKAKIQGVLNDRYGRKAWFKKYSSKLSQMKFAGKPKDIKLGDYKVKQVQTKRAFQLAIIAAIVFSIFFGVKTAQNVKIQKEKETKEAQLIAQIEQFTDKAQRQVKSDPASAETALFSAKKIIADNKVDSSKLESTNKEKFEEILGVTQSLDDEINKIVPLVESENLELFLDGRIAFGDNSSPSDIGLFVDADGNESLVVTDLGEKSVYNIDLFTKKSTALSDPDRVVTAPLYVDYGNNGIYVFDNQVGVVNFPLGDDGKTLASAKALSGLSRNSFGSDIRELAILNSTDWVYVIDASKGGLVRSTNNEGSYGLPSISLADSSIATANDFFADLSFYVMGSGETPIKRFNSGGGAGLAEAPFAIVGSRQSMGELTAGYTGASLNFGLYAFSSTNKSVMKFEKPIEGGGELLHPGELLFLKQYVYRGSKSGVFENVKDIVVDSTEKSTYVLDGTKIWKITN